VQSARVPGILGRTVGPGSYTPRLGGHLPCPTQHPRVSHLPPGLAGAHGRLTIRRPRDRSQRSGEGKILGIVLASIGFVLMLWLLGDSLATRVTRWVEIDPGMFIEKESVYVVGVVVTVIGAVVYVAAGGRRLASAERSALGAISVSTKKQLRIVIRVLLGGHPYSSDKPC
jgi:hypothetical protein